MDTTNQTATAQSNTGTAPVQIHTADILAKLNSGMSREEIRLELGLKKAQFNRLMKTPSLKGKKGKTAHRTDPFVIVDDATGQQTPIATEEAEQEAAGEETGSTESVYGGGYNA